MAENSVVRGEITNVVEVPVGTVLATDHAAGVGALDVADPDALDWDGGELVLGDEVFTYTIDESTGQVGLDDVTTTAYEADEPVYVHPRQVERIAFFLEPEGVEELEAVVPLALYDRIAAGPREEREQIEVLQVGDTLMVNDVIAVEPSIDGSYINPETLPVPPPPDPTDGEPPEESPDAVVVGGLGSLVVTWEPVENNDPVTYEVHVADSSGFIPGPATLAGEIQGTLMFVRQLPGAGPLVAGTTYYVQILAKDDDGPAESPGAEASGTPAQATHEDIAAENVYAEHLLADEALFEKLKTVLLVANTIQVPADEGQRIKLHQDGIFLYNGAGEEMVSFDAASGTVYVRGTVQFGGSVLTSDDTIDLKRQATDWQNPVHVQTGYGRRWAGGTGVTSGSLGFQNPTTPGNLVLAVIACDPTATVTLPAGWTTIEHVNVGSDLRLMVARRTLTGVMDSPLNIGFSANTRWVGVVLEYAGVALAAPVSTSVQTNDDSSGPVTYDPGSGAAGVAFGISARTAPGDAEFGDGLDQGDGFASVAEHSNAWSEGPRPGLPGPGLDITRLSVSAKEIAPDGVATHEHVWDSDITPRINVIFTLARKAGGNPEPPASGSGKLRLFAKTVGADSFLKHITEAGNAVSLLETAQDKKVMVAFGRQSSAWGGTNGGLIDFAHGLGDINVHALFCTPDREASAVGFRLYASAGVLSSTHFRIGFRSNNDSNQTGAVYFWWLCLYSPA